MNFSISALSEKQWFKVAKAAIYSFISGFLGALALSINGVVQAGGTFDETVLKALIIASTGGGINTLIVFVKQLFTPSSSSN